MEELFDEVNPKVDNVPVKANKELFTLNIVTEKYKNIVINGISIPSTIFTNDTKEAKVIDERREVSDITDDEKLWLETNINFICEPNGDFITINSGNQYAFYQTLLRIHYFIYAHNIPFEYFKNDRYYKLYNIGYLIDGKNYNSNIDLNFIIQVDLKMHAIVENRNHMFNKFDSFGYALFSHEENYYNKHNKEAKIKGSVYFDDIKDFDNWITTVVLIHNNPRDNNIVSMFNKLNPVYLTHTVKTSDTFRVFASPKAYVSRTEGNNCAFSLAIYPKFIINDNMNLISWFSNAKNIEVKMEQLSNKIKAVCDKYTYK